MSQFDWVGGAPQQGKPFKDIRNQRESTAEVKARLMLELGGLINKIPERIKSGGSVNAVREWQARRAACAKVAASARSSVPEIEGAINQMQALERKA